ncbi:hypothetical protein [Pseudoalteromonas umbrosa]|uniref:hypothetical protein n=1 Tax=Pseudoalteromonas umbrosa TaxID=3048489 RepID=UPI0024C35A85|nr:hypothetical protein [Pseudoalteromonas sp. B95]MDK1290095.1 hypothetical protein [Pseudoalteromonas sp. B95]
MITANILNSSGEFEAIQSAPEQLNALSVPAATRGKEQLMIYTNFAKVSDLAAVKLTFLMADPKVNAGEPFVMSTLNGATVVPMEMNIVTAGALRIPIPVASNEREIIIKADIVNGVVGQDSFEFWVSLNTYQPVSGLIQ